MEMMSQKFQTRGSFGFLHPAFLSVLSHTLSHQWLVELDCDIMIPVTLLLDETANPNQRTALKPGRIPGASVP
jgi:hypothetical protein